MPTVEITDPNRSAKNPERPCGHMVGPHLGMKPCVNREGAIGRNEDQEKTEKTDEIEVVEIDHLIEKKAKRDPQKKKNRASAIAKAERNINREHTEKPEVQIHPNARPGVDPREAVV